MSTNVQWREKTKSSVIQYPAYVRAHCKERTYDLYSDTFRLHLLPHFGQKDIAAISKEEVKRLAYSLLARGKSRATVKSILTPLSGIFSMAVEDGHLTSNPALRILKRSRVVEGNQQDRLQPFTWLREYTRSILADA